MVDLPQKKIGIIACSGEELPEGTVTRLAALKVLENLRPSDTVTICLPLFLAGGEGDRAFAKFYPTIAIDGCEKRCAFHGTEKYSNRPAVGFVVTDIISDLNLQKPLGLKKLDNNGMQAVEMVAEVVAVKVDELLGRSWSRRDGKFAEEPKQPEGVATCSCGSGISIQKVDVKGQEMTLVALPLIFQNIYSRETVPGKDALQDIMEMVKIYNAVDPKLEVEITEAVANAYASYSMDQERKK
jgi:uncharacterized metal-binding protein